MVRSFLSRIIYWLVLWSVSSLAWAQTVQPMPGYEITVKPQEIMLGEAIRFEVKGDKLEQVFQHFDLQKLSEHFVIDDLDQHRDSVRFKLYPLHAGELEIAAQQAGFLQIPAFKIKVAENPQVEVRWRFPPEKAYSQQLLAWSAEVEVSNPAFKVTYQSQNYHRNDGYESLLQEQAVNLAEIQEMSLVRKVLGAITHKMMAVLVMPDALSAQNLQLHSPLIEVKNTSNKRWKFFAAPQNLALQPLPSFLPLSAPVGQIDWQADAPSHFYQTGKLYYWRWELTAHQLTKDYLQGALYPLLNQLQQAHNIEFMSESMNAQQSFDENGLLSKVKVDIPYRVNSSGWVRLPELHLRFFNPETGLVEHKQMASQLAFAVPVWLVWILQWLALFIGLGLVFFMLVYTQQAWRNWRFKSALKKLLTKESAKNPDGFHDELWLLMQQWQQQHRTWRLCLKCLRQSLLGRHLKSQTLWQQIIVSTAPQVYQGSFAQWNEWYVQNYAPSVHLQQLLMLLNQRYFSRQESIDLHESIKACVQRWLDDF